MQTQPNDELYYTVLQRVVALGLPIGRTLCCLLPHLPLTSPWAEHKAAALDKPVLSEALVRFALSQQCFRRAILHPTAASTPSPPAGGREQEVDDDDDDDEDDETHQEKEPESEKKAGRSFSFSPFALDLFISQRLSSQNKSCGTSFSGATVNMKSS